MKITVAISGGRSITFENGARQPNRSSSGLIQVKTEWRRAALVCPARPEEIEREREREKNRHVVARVAFTPEVSQEKDGAGSAFRRFHPSLRDLRRRE